jgi:glycosyltransferase involved in cell wall biosynthesis
VTNQLVTPTPIQRSHQRSLKLLMSAYACEPGRGSEPGIGWNTVREAAVDHEVWVLTSATHRPQIEAELRDRPIPNLNFVYVDPLGWVYDWSQEGKRSHWDVYLHYYLWQIEAYRVAGQLHQQIKFDVAQHVTYLKYSSPSFVSLLPIPFVWGPVGGGESPPAIFEKDLTPRAKLYESLRSFARSVGEFDPFVRLTAHRSRLVLAATEETATRLRKFGVKEVEVRLPIALNKSELEVLTQFVQDDEAPIRFMSIGRLLHWKGFHLGLQAFAQAKLPDTAEYWIVGEGPEAEALRSLAKQLGIAHQVKFLSQLPRTETLEQLRNCFALVHPSLHDSGGFVCLEAMAAACPVICLDLGGPGVMVTPETGFKVPATTPEQVVDVMAKAMVMLVQESDLRKQLGQAARDRVLQKFSWRSKAMQFNEDYQYLMESSNVVAMTVLEQN